MGCILNPIFALTILLILATNIEICPGPRTNFAGYFKNIRRTQGSKVCEISGELYYIKCLKDRFERVMERFHCSLCNVNIDHENCFDCAGRGKYSMFSVRKYKS